MNRTKKLLLHLSKSSEDGMGFLEFAIVLPLILVPVIFGGIEVGRMVIALEHMSTISREAVNEAYRTCSVDSDKEPQQITQLGDRYQTYALNDMGATNDDVRVVVSMFYLPEGSPATNNSVQFYSNVASNATFCDQQIRSKWSDGINAAIPDGDPAWSVLTRAGVEVLVMSEVFYCYRPLVSFIPGWGNRLLSESTVY